jgi:hypothetical protein
MERTARAKLQHYPFMPTRPEDDASIPSGIVLLRRDPIGAMITFREAERRRHVAGKTFDPLNLGPSVPLAPQVKTLRR